MSLRDHAKAMLKRSRGLLESVLKSFESEDDWFYQTHPKANHAMWIVAHVGLADDTFISRFRPEWKNRPEGWDDLFWFGSELKSDTSVYPPSAEVLAYAQERRAKLLELIDDLSDEELYSDAPAEGEQSVIAGAPCMGHLFLFAAYHEGIHTGQLTVCHRGLGKDPLRSPKPAKA